MPLPHWIWKPDRIGAIAMANLVLLEICLLTLIWAPATLEDGIQVPQIIAGAGLLILSFPLGWMGEFLFGGFQSSSLHAFVSLPLNAYLWGGFLELVLQHRATARRFGLPAERSPDPGGEEQREED
jgi:hypothetical protein